MNIFKIGAATIGTVECAFIGFYAGYHFINRPLKDIDERLVKYDENRDNVLSKDEWEKFILNEVDKNKDGRLSDKELEEFRSLAQHFNPSHKRNIQASTRGLINALYDIGRENPNKIAPNTISLSSELFRMLEVLGLQQF